MFYYVYLACYNAQDRVREEERVSWGGRKEEPKEKEKREGEISPRLPYACTPVAEEEEEKSPSSPYVCRRAQGSDGTRPRDHQFHTVSCQELSLTYQFGELIMN